MRDVAGAGAGRGPVVVERAEGLGGELVLRRAGTDFEIISNGMFLMDTRNGESERLLVRTAVGRASPARQNTGTGTDAGARVLIGGLGVGFSLAEAVRLPRVSRVTVVEREPAVIAWHGTYLRAWSQGALDDPRVRVECADLVGWLERPPDDPDDPDGRDGLYDAVCLDIDNGPEWTVTPGNARLYGTAGLDALARRLAPGGVLAVWSAGAAPAFEGLLRGRFARVEVCRVPVPRGEPDVVYLAGEPNAAARPVGGAGDAASTGPGAGAGAGATNPGTAKLWPA